MAVTMSQLLGTTDDCQLDLLCRTALSESFEVKKRAQQ